MPSKTKRRNASQAKHKKKPMDTRAKMFLVLALCSLALLLTAAGCLLLVGGFIGGKGDKTPTATPEPLVVESDYDHTQNAIDVEEYAATILGVSEDAGQEYIDETLFLGDSNTARMYRMFDYCSYANAIGSVGMSASALVDYPCVLLSSSSKYVTMPQAVAQLQPRRIILTFGTNDLNPNRSAEQFVASYQAGIEAVQAAYPSADIIINAIPPLGQEHSGSNLTQGQVDAYNKALVEMCSAMDWKFLNSAEALKDSATGFAKAGYVETSDGIHLTKPAMEALFNYIRTHSYITEDDRPPLTAIPTHTGEKDVVVYVAPTPAPVATPAPEATPVPEATVTPEGEQTPSADNSDSASSEVSEPAVSESTAEPTPPPESTAEPTPPPESESSSEPAAPESESSSETDAPESESSSEANAEPPAPARSETSRIDPTCVEAGFIYYSDGSEERFGGPLGHSDGDGNGSCDRCGTSVA